MKREMSESEMRKFWERLCEKIGFWGRSCRMCSTIPMHVLHVRPGAEKIKAIFRAEIRTRRDLQSARLPR
jgi:hypothetical protein